MNKIHRNRGNGIETRSGKSVRCDTVVKLNEIFRNGENGILCEGALNFSRIEKNISISCNRKSGIIVSDDATVVIIKNKVYGNFSQGILLVEGTSAHIEQNEIYTNFKANIALGGRGSADTVIINNDLYSGRAEGLFAIEAGYFWLQNNRIHGNSDGVTLVDSSPFLKGN